MTSKSDDAHRPGDAALGRKLPERLAATNLLFLLPIGFLVATIFLWQWSTDRERERIGLITRDEGSRVADATADRLQGHADVSARSGNRWLLREPIDGPEWDFDVFSRRWLHPELLTVEWLDSELNARWWPSNQQPMVAGMLSPEDLERAADEHRVVLAGPFFSPNGEPISITIVPIPRSGGDFEWVVSMYDLERVLRAASRGTSGSFAVRLRADGREVFTSHADEPVVPEIPVQTMEVGYDLLELEQEVWVRGIALERFQTLMPQLTLLFGALATVTLALGIRLAQVSSRRAIEGRMTASLQHEVRARRAAEKSLERKLDELVRSNQEFERFAYAISHDLRDPLNAIHLNVQSVLSQVGGELDAADRRRLEQGTRAVSRLDAMIGRLLEYARAGGGSDGLELVDAQEALDDAVANLQGVVEEHDASVRSNSLPQIIAHRAALVQLFQNLVANAVKYRGERTPVIDVEAVKGDDEWVFSVADNARGMDEEEVEDAFDLFWRRPDGNGTGGEGIGLAVCKRIVERQGGRIWAESQRGEGTTVYFSWPADPDAAGRYAPKADRSR